MADSESPIAGEVVHRTRLVHWILILALVGCGALLRFHQITRESQWQDEYWTLYLSMGRGGDAFNLPAGELLNPPPAEMLAGAPHWWHIWTGLDRVTHPPLYSILLRWWMDLFGDGDLSTRGFSTALSLASIVLIFDAVRIREDPRVAMLAALAMTVATSAIDYSQQTRNYMLEVLLIVWIGRELCAVEVYGPTCARLARLGAAVLATLFTHYFAVGAAMGAGVYALLALRGKTRSRTVAVILGVTAVFVLAWGPFLWRQRQDLGAQGWWTADKVPGHFLALWRAAKLPAAHFAPTISAAGSPIPGQTMITIALELVVFVLPLLSLRSNRAARLWWCMLICSIAPPVAYDMLKHSELLYYPKYSMAALPALCVLVVLPLPFRQWWRWAVSLAMVFMLLTAAVDRWQEGPEPMGDFRGVVRRLDGAAGPTDPILFFAGSGWNSPAFWYLPFNHYAPQSRRPVMMVAIGQPLDAAATAQLSGYKTIWIFGPSFGADAAALVPGWKAVDAIGSSSVGGFTRLQRIDAAGARAITSTGPSQPASR